MFEPEGKKTEGTEQMLRQSTSENRAREMNLFFFFFFSRLAFRRYVGLREPVV